MTKKKAPGDRNGRTGTEANTSSNGTPSHPDPAKALQELVESYDPHGTTDLNIDPRLSKRFLYGSAILGAASMVREAYLQVEYDEDGRIDPEWESKFFGVVECIAGSMSNLIQHMIDADDDLESEIIDVFGATSDAGY